MLLSYYCSFSYVEPGLDVVQRVDDGVQAVPEGVVEGLLRDTNSNPNNNPNNNNDNNNNSISNNNDNDSDNNNDNNNNDNNNNSKMAYYKYTQNTGDSDNGKVSSASPPVIINTII